MNGLELKPFTRYVAAYNVFQNHKLKMKLLGFFFTFLLIFFFSYIQVCLFIILFESNCYL